MRLVRLQRLAENAKRDLEPFNRWLQAGYIECGEIGTNDPEKEEQITRLEVKSAEYQDRKKRQGKLEKKEYEASSNRWRAKEEVEFAEGYKAVRLDNLGETVERAALIKVAQEDVRSAQTKFEEEKESTEKIELKGKMLNALSSISCIKGKLRRHNVLLEWIEQQRREIGSGRADTENEGGQGQSKRASPKTLRNHSATVASRPNKRSKASGRKRKQSMARSIRSPVDLAKVSKAPSRRRSSHQKMSVLYDVSQPAEKTTTDSSTPETRSKQAFSVIDMRASLRPYLFIKTFQAGRKTAK